MSKLLKLLLAFALPMYVTDGGGGGSEPADQPLNTDSFAEMLGADGDNGQPETDPQNVEPDQDPIVDPDPDAVDPDVDPDADPAPDPDGQPDPNPDPADAFLELEINGEKVKVSKDEAKNGYLRQQDYTQKAQRLAQERQEWGQHVASQAAEVQQFSREIGALHNIDAALAEYQAVDWNALREADPVSYGAHLAEFNDLRARRGDMAAGIQQKREQLTAAQRQDFAQKSQEAAQHMATVIPGFSKEHAAEMRAYGLKMGFSPAELANVADKRSLEVLYKAAQYDKQQNSTQKAIKKVAALPTKAAKAAPASKPAAQLNIDKQTRRLEQTGSVKDFAALLGMTKR